MQELVAVLECTDREFLPDDWQERMRATGWPNATAGTTDGTAAR